MAGGITRRISIAVCCALSGLAGAANGELAAFPGAVGQGAATVGGRGGDVYHVTNLEDYSRKRREQPIEGSLRHGIESADGPRTIVFDVAGAIPLAGRLEIENERLTIAGQSSPGGITLWGYPVEIDGAKDVVIRFVRVRCGEFNARPFQRDGAPPAAAEGRGNKDLDASSANAIDVGGGSERVILDHMSAAWGMDETCSVTHARDITIQHSIIAESLNNSFHAKGPHGFGSLVRGEVTAADQAAGRGGYTLFGNLWAHHMQRSPSIGGQQHLRNGESESERRGADVNLINNVVYDWGQRPTHRSESGEIRINFVRNYHVNGAAKSGAYVFYENNPAQSSVYQEGNFLDADQDADHDGRAIDTPERVAAAFQRFDEKDVLLSANSDAPFNFFASVAGEALPADEAYSRVVEFAGASLWRDAIDQRVIDSLVRRAGGIVNSPEEFRGTKGKIPGIDDLKTASRPVGFDTDHDGLPNDWESQRGLDPHDSADGQRSNLSSAGYTNLEVYLHELAAPAMSVH
jgi:hypothetical protein